MITLQLGAAIIALIIGIAALYFFNKKAIKNHNFAFFTLASFIMSAISLSMILVGFRWFFNATPNGDDVMNGIGMGIIGVIVALFLMISNAGKTNLLSAIAGLAIQFLIMGALVVLGNNFL